jgi:MFS family permease
MNQSQSLALVRLGLAATLAPLAAPVITTLLIYGSDSGTTDSGFAWGFGFAAAFGYLGLFLAGIPILIWLKRLQRLDLLSLTLCGAIAGVVIFQLFLFVFGLLLESSGGHDLLSLAYGALAGAAVAGSFRFWPRLCEKTLIM